MNQVLSVYLDLMRLLAAGMVLVTHINSHSVAGPLLWRISGHGTEGVIAFFVLSGFVISYVASRREQTAREYVVARAARMYSVAVLAIPITLVADAIGLQATPTLYYGHSYFNTNTGIADLLGSLTFVNELWSNHIVVGSNEPYWSLGFEVWYYLMFGVAFFAPRYIRAACAIALAAVAGPKIVLYFSIWLLGCLTFHIIEQARRRQCPPVPPIAGAILFVLSPVAYLLLHTYCPPMPVFFGTFFRLNALAAETWLYCFLVGSLFATHLIGFAAISPVFSALFGRLGPMIRWAAGASFTLYLVHQPVMFCLAAIAPWPLATVPRLLFVGVGTLAIILLVAELGERRKHAWQRAINATLDWFGAHMVQYRPFRGS